MAEEKKTKKSTAKKKELSPLEDLQRAIKKYAKSISKDESAKSQIALRKLDELEPWLI